jgi:ferredoxin
MSMIRERAEEMLKKEIDPVFKEVAGLLEPKLKDSKYMPWIMERLMNIDQARILLALPDMDHDESLGRLEVSEQFAKKLNMDVDTVKKHIRYLYENGMAFPTRRGPQPPRSLAQWIDTQNHPDYFEALGDEYYALIGMFSDNEQREGRDDRIAQRLSTGQPSFSRIIPRWKSIENNPGMIPADDIRALIRANDTFALLHCACRIRFKDRECGVPEETCLVLGRTAAYNIDRGAARQITLDEALDFVTNETVKYPTVHIGRRATPENFSGILCNCHYDCCGVMRPPMVTGSKYPIQEFYAPSRYRATVDPEDCVACRVCVDKRCQFGAAQMKFYPEYGEERAYIDEDICMGCGNCVETCPSGIRGMKIVEPPETLTEAARRDIYGAGGQGF